MGMCGSKTMRSILYAFSSQMFRLWIKFYTPTQCLPKQNSSFCLSFPKKRYEIEFTVKVEREEKIFVKIEEVNSIH